MRTPNYINERLIIGVIITVLIAIGYGVKWFI